MTAICDRSAERFVKLSEIAEKVIWETFSFHCADGTDETDFRKTAFSTATDIVSLDDRFSSFEPGKLYIIGGRPGMGKKTLMTQIAVNIAASEGKPVYILSLEQSAEHLVLRMISQIVDVSQNNVKNGTLTYENKDLIVFCQSVMSEMPIYICDEPSNVYKDGRLAADEIDDGILMIDYLQLLQPLKEKNANRNNPNCSKAPAQGQCEVISALKRLAQEKRIPVVVCSQLGRSVEQREDKRPFLQDLPMAQEIDGVIFLYRDSYYTKNENADAEIIFAKNCGGQTGTAYAVFDNRRLMFKGRFSHGAV